MFAQLGGEARFEIKFLPSPPTPPKVHVPIVKGMRHPYGHIEVYSGLVIIVDEIGIEFHRYQLTLFGAPYYRAHAMPWKKVHSVNYEGGRFQLRGTQTDGQTWHWTFQCSHPSLLLRSLAQHIHVEGYQAPHAAEVAPAPGGEAAGVKPVQPDLLLRDLRRIAKQVEKDRSVLAEKSVITWLAQELDASPFRVVQGLIALAHQNDEARSLVVRAGIPHEIQFYEALLMFLPDPAGELAQMVVTENKPIFTWLEANGAAEALARLYEWRPDLAALLAAFTVDERLRLFDCLLARGGSKREAGEKMLRGQVRELGQYRLGMLLFGAFCLASLAWCGSCLAGIAWCGPYWSYYADRLDLLFTYSILCWQVMLGLGAIVGFFLGFASHSDLTRARKRLLALDSG